MNRSFAIRCARIVLVLFIALLGFGVVAEAAQAGKAADSGVEKEIKGLKAELKSLQSQLRKINEEGSEVDQEKAQDLMNRIQVLRERIADLEAKSDSGQTGN